MSASLVPAGLVPPVPGMLNIVGWRVTSVCDIAWDGFRTGEWKTFASNTFRPDIFDQTTRRSVIAWLLEHAVPRAWIVAQFGDQRDAGEAAAALPETPEWAVNGWRRECLRWAYPFPDAAARAPAEVLRLLEMVAAEARALREGSVGP